VHRAQQAILAFSAVVVLALTVGVTSSTASQAPPEQQPPPSQSRPPDQAPPADQSRQAKDPAPIQGDLVSVDADAKRLTVKTADNKEVQFSYDDSTEVQGAKGGAAGLATMKEGRVTVHFKEDAQTKAKLATRIIVHPKQ
jgi:hypothetical protein